MTKHLIAISLLVLANGAAIATPTIVDSLPSERISFADLDLGGQAGMTTLQARIRGAARHLCLPSDVQPLAERLRERTCQRLAITNANRQIDRLIAKRVTGVVVLAAALPVGTVR